jgi:hypothetical protein
MRFKNWFWNSFLIWGIIGCAAPNTPNNETGADSLLVNTHPAGDTKMDAMPNFADSSTHDSIPAELQPSAQDSTLKKAKTNQRPKEKKEYLPYLPGKSDAWELRKQDSIRKAQQK